MCPSRLKECKTLRKKKKVDLTCVQPLLPWPVLITWHVKSQGAKLIAFVVPNEERSKGVAASSKTQARRNCV